MVAGRRHHTIPQFLLGGFASKRSGDNAFVWVYRKDQREKELNIKNVSVDRDFYGGPDDASADVAITDFEGHYAPLVEVLRSHPRGPVADDRIPMLVAHFVVRTRHLRQSLDACMGSLLEKVREQLTSQDVLREAVLNDPRLIELVKKELDKSGIAPDHHDTVFLSIRPHLGVALDGLMPDMLATIDSGVDIARKQFPIAMRDALNAATAMNPGADVRAANYEKMRWFITEPNVPILLGDSICVFQTNGKRPFKPVDEKGDEVQRILLPLSSKRLLIGTTYVATPDIEGATVNKAVARCSLEFFVSSGVLPRNSALSKGIGRWAGVLSADELIAIKDAMRLGGAELHG